MSLPMPPIEGPVPGNPLLPQDPIYSFFSALYGPDRIPGVLNIWTLPDKKSYFFRERPYETLASKQCRELAENHDVYFGVGLLREALSPDRRGRAEDVVAIPGLWADIDIKGPNHSQENLPGSIEDALALARSLPLKPTLIVFSGGGIQAYWLFKKLWVFGSAEERDRAAKLSKRFQATLLAGASKRGWKIDNTADLARVLRVPGMYNRKNGQVAVEIIDYQPDSRHDPGEFEPWIAAETKAKNELDAGRVDPHLIFSGIPKGQRNTELYRYACSLRSRNVPFAEARILISAAAGNCRPEYPSDEAVKMLGRAYREHPAGNNSGKESGWPEPRELPSLLPQAPALPPEMLPDGLRPWLED
ncbi:MAG: hypothetical protein JXR49_11655, partial [Acidobacteria bacterium]|nr:hypothetical protein [Acidobacteriota bacterium]